MHFPAALLAAAALVSGCRSAAPSELLGRSRGFDFVVSGNDSLGAGELERVLSFDLEEFEREGFRRSTADDVAFEALVHYRRQGFAFAEVDYEVSKEGDRPRLALRVQEGPRVFLDESALRLVGITEFSAAEALTFFDGERVGGMLGGGRVPYSEQALSGAVSALEREYVARGYLEVRTESPQVTFGDDRRSARVSVTVREGPRYLCGAVEWDRETIPVDLRDALRVLTDDFPFTRVPGQEPVRRAYTARLPFELRGAVQELFGNAARPEAIVEVRARFGDEQDGERRARLLLTVDPGPKVSVGTIDVRGNEATSKGLVLSRLRLEPGDPWSNEAIRTSVRRLYRTGLFQRVDLARVVPQGGAGEDADRVDRDLRVDLQEGPTREVFLEPGYGSYELFRLRAGARERNLFGTGRQLRTEATWGLRALRGLVGLRDPWLFRSDADLIGDLNANFDERENPSFTSRSIGAGAFVTKEWSETDSTTFGYQFRRSKISNVDVKEQDLPEVQDALDDVDLSTLRLSHRRDRRDNPLLPRENTFLEASLEWGDQTIGSELDFVRATLSAAAYRPLTESTVLALAFRTGVITAMGSDTIPLQERFFNGGENTVRSFLESELGPVDSDGHPLGGEAFHVANLELRQQVPDTRFEVALFYDVGDLAQDAGDWGAFEDVRTGIGAGVRYLLPVGPVRLDVGWNPDPRAGEDAVAVHFAIGIAF